MKGKINMRSIGLGRRTALAGGVALASASLIRSREARAAKGLTVVLESEVTILDPHATTAAITRTFGTHVFDTLFAMNDKGESKPQPRQADMDVRPAGRAEVA
jgi:peptide/nickel transport system substrate-binding protein